MGDSKIGKLNLCKEKEAADKDDYINHYWINPEENFEKLSNS